MYNQMADLSSSITLGVQMEAPLAMNASNRRAIMRANALIMAALEYRKKWIERHSDYTNDRLYE